MAEFARIGEEVGTALREQLLDRRDRLARAPDIPDVHALLHEVDAALEHMDAGTYGECARCDGTVEPDRLQADPLTRVCLDCLDAGETRALELDLQTAASAQSALLPAEEIRHAGWEVRYSYHPLGPVSGDHCDILPTEGPDGALHVVLGDVSGKGVAASLVMAHLHAVLRGLAHQDLGLTNLLARANRLVCESTLPNVYVTLVAARLSPSGYVELANAGHNPPLLLRDGETAPLPCTGLPLGMFCGSAFDVRRFELVPGDSLLLYTDGLSEARDRSGDVYGEKRIVAAAERSRRFSAADALRACLDDVRSFRGEARREDDLTMMVVRRTGPSA